MDEMRLYFEKNGAVTRYLRRKHLHLMENRMLAAVWLSLHPHDL
jgi:hypothetical protein